MSLWTKIPGSKILPLKFVKKHFENLSANCVCVKLSYSFINGWGFQALCSSLLPTILCLYVANSCNYCPKRSVGCKLKWNGDMSERGTSSSDPWCPFSRSVLTSFKGTFHHIVDVCIFIRNVCLALENILPEYENKPYWQLSASCSRWSTESDYTAH